MSRSTKGLTGSGSGFKAFQKTGPQLKVSSYRREKPRIEPATPGLQDIGLSPTPRQLLILLFVAVFLNGCTSTGRVGLCFLWFFVQELQKAQPAVVLVLKLLRRRGNSLKSHPTDWEKPGIEPATKIWIGQSLLTVSLSSIHRQNLKNISFFSMKQIIFRVS